VGKRGLDKISPKSGKGCISCPRVERCELQCWRSHPDNLPALSCVELLRESQVRCLARRGIIRLQTLSGQKNGVGL
jgi:hypothetical protein